MAKDDHQDTQDYAGFFVALDECVTCGCCQAYAPNNFSWTKSTYTNSRGERNSESSQIQKQPETEVELEKIVSAITGCMVDCIYYGGSDTKVIEYLLDRDVQPFSIVHCDKS